MNLRELLAAKEQYPDDHKIQLASGVEVTMGDIRAFAEEQQSDARSKLAELNLREQALAAAANDIAEAQARIQNLQPNANGNPEVQRLVELLTNATRGGQKVSIFDEPGDYFKPLVERFQEASENLAAQKAAFEKQQKEVEQTLAWHLRNQVKRDYRMHNDWPEGFDATKAVTYAKQNRLVDEMGYPDFDAVHERITAPVRQKETLETERKKIREEERAVARTEAAQQHRDAYVSMPNGGGGAGAPKGKKYGGVEKIDENEVLNDPDILATFNSLN